MKTVKTQKVVKTGRTPAKRKPAYQPRYHDIAIAAAYAYTMRPEVQRKLAMMPRDKCREKLGKIYAKSRELLLG